jgi:hypothetical protein
METGLTLEYLQQIRPHYGAVSPQMCTRLDRSSRRSVPKPPCRGATPYASYSRSS